MKKRLSKFNLIITALLSVMLILFGTIFSVIFYKRSRGIRQDYLELNGTANKVVLFIGDGMGENHIKTASAYLEREIFFTGFEINGHCTTYSNALFSPTDSAASASALATGQKFDNKEVSRHNGENITTISELAINKGYCVGIVTTDSLDGATPACFSSHANKRGDSDEIISNQIVSNIKLFLGAGKNKYDTHTDALTNNGYEYINDYSQLNINSDKIFGSFERVASSDGTNTIPTLQMLTNFAIEYMDQNCPLGYFLMIEGAHIDKRSHDNNIMSMIRYLDNFDESIKTAYNLIGNKNGSAIIVTADHETGGLRYNGETKNEINDKMYTRLGHTSNNVPYYVHINSNKSINTNNLFSPVIDNTDIFRLCKSCLNVWIN